KLIMSLDCSYEELCAQMMGPQDVGSSPRVKIDARPQIDKEVLKRFKENLNAIKQGGISRLHNFVKNLHKMLVKRTTESSRHHEYLPQDEPFRINRLSMAGLF